MRRVMLRPYGSGALTPVGGASSANSSTEPDELMFGGTAAAESGTITSIDARLTNAQTCRFFTIRQVTGVWTVRAATSNISGLTGLNTYAVSLAIVTGDLIGIYLASFGAMRYAPGGGTWYTKSSPVVPGAGTTYTGLGSSGGRQYALVGMGVL